MGALHFAAPIVLKGDRACELDCIESAIEFLEAWPAQRRGPVHACALNSCKLAAAGAMRPADARRSVESFARITGILARSAAPVVPVEVAASKLHTNAA